MAHAPPCSILASLVELGIVNDWRHYGKPQGAKKVSCRIAAIILGLNYTGMAFENLLC